ncbi:Uu.00g079390.m01.CDS01 [Anthostomella pinea]|uniref:Uu.00g079390.m01.CDS01 n=1 Tax=Anthostomella pinea TaxID=933095 RepID=A0AAI8YJC4_9PEZI|nr:Uu.00g079390.m01.CDS01 [Anthostomella pinea]
MTPNKDLTGHKLLVITPTDLNPEYLEHLHSQFPGLKVVHSKFDPWRSVGLPPDVSDDDWKTVTILLTGPKFPTREQAPNLQLVQLQSAGANYILDNPLFKDTKIPFCTANGVHGPPISEWVICTYLAHQHRIPRFLDNMKEGKWDSEHGSDAPDIQDAVSQRVGILGYGSIGRQVARVATAMGMEVYAYTNRPRPTPESRHDDSYYVPGLGDPEGVLPSKWFSGTKPEEVDEFLSSGLDLLVLAVPLTPQTRGMIAAPQFKLLAGKKTYVTNIGRGPVVNTDDLMTALDEGWIRGAALDVTDPEPLPKEHPLWHKRNLIITPHVSGNSSSYGPRLLAILDINLKRLSEGKDFINSVSRKRGY